MHDNSVIVCGIYLAQTFLAHQNILILGDQLILQKPVIPENIRGTGHFRMLMHEVMKYAENI